MELLLRKLEVVVESLDLARDNRQTIAELIEASRERNTRVEDTHLVRVFCGKKGTKTAKFRGHFWGTFLRRGTFGAIDGAN
ncbi:hypothetical protein [Aeromonas sp. QDB18]|uniref:hypothetical protein n=1 Tax=Aeromonas sp. QDB18 TaxID=2990486 RepID=UPI0022DEAA0B|nr:hypothetical protein [Aeromonas sp. QDB18]